MYSLRAVLAQCGVLANLVESMDDLRIPDARIKELQRDIGKLILDALVESGKTVVEDFKP